MWAEVSSQACVEKNNHNQTDPTFMTSLDHLELINDGFG